MIVLEVGKKEDEFVNNVWELKGEGLMENEQWVPLTLGHKKPRQILIKELKLPLISIQVYGKRNLRSWAYGINPG